MAEQTASSASENSDKKKTAKLSVLTLVVMNVVVVVSLRCLPAEAEYGLGSIFYFLFAAAFCLIPVPGLTGSRGVGSDAPPEGRRLSVGW